MKSGSPHVFVVDDDEPMRRSLSRLLRSKGYTVDTLASSQELLAAEVPNAPVCLILDLQMPDLDGLELQKHLGKRQAMMPIIFHTGHGSIPQSVQALKAGAVDFLTKPCDDKILLAAVGQALSHSRSWWREEAARQAVQEDIDRLTPREHEVLRWILTGRLNKQIAGELGTTERTIKAHRSQVMTKLDVCSVADLVRLAERAGISPAD